MKKSLIFCMILGFVYIFAPIKSVKAAFYLDPGDGGSSSDQIAPGAFTDINSLSFFNDTFQGIKWEYDFNELIINPLRRMDDGYGSMGYYANYLPFISYEDGAGYYYKSFIVKYNPKLYREINIILTSYASILSEECDEIEDLMDKNALVAVSDVIFGMDPDKVGAVYSLLKNNDITEIANLFAKSYINKSTNGLLDEVPFLEEIYDLFIDKANTSNFIVNGVPSLTVIRNEAINFLSKDFAEWFTQAAIDMAFEMFVGAVVKYYPITGAIIKAFTYIRQHLIYQNMLEYRQDIIDNIEKITQMLSSNPRNWGINLRLDYIVDTPNVLPRNIANNPSAIKNYLETNNIIDVLITPSNSDGFYVRPYNHSTIQDQVFNYQTFDYEWITNRYISPKGLITQVTSNQIIQELKNAISYSPDSKPRKLSAPSFVYRTFMSETNPERVQQTVDTNKFITLNPIGGAPLLTSASQRYVTSSSLGLTINYTNPQNTYVSTTVHVCKGAYSPTNKCSEGVYTTQSFNSSNVNVLGLKPSTQYHYFVTLDYRNTLNNTITSYFVYTGSALTMARHVDTPSYALTTKSVLDNQIKVQPYIIKGTTSNFTVLSAQLNVYNNNNKIYTKTITDLSDIVLTNLYQNTEYKFEIVLTYKDVYQNIMEERSYSNTIKTTYSTGGGGGGGGTNWLEGN